MRLPVRSDWERESEYLSILDLGKEIELLQSEAQTLLETSVNDLESSIATLEGLIEANLTQLATQSFTPVWSVAGGTAPSFGNAVITSNYVTIGRLVIWNFMMVAGTTTTFGTSGWRFSLPRPVSWPGSIQHVVGSGTVTDTSASLRHVATCQVDPVQGLFVQTDGANSTVTSGVPFMWAQTDILAFQVMYFSNI